MLTRLLRCADRAATVALGAAAAILLILVAARALGYQALIERSASMQPAIRTGDLLASRTIPVRGLRVGDVATFPDAARPGVLLTHRVVAIRRGGSRVDITTRGDANRAAERWSAPAGDRVGRVALTLPRLGYVLVRLDDGRLRGALSLVACAGLGAAALRWIWRSP